MFKWLGQVIQRLIHSPLFLAFKEFCQQVFDKEKVILIGALKDIAIQAVATAQTTGLDNAAKRVQAFGQIQAYAKVKGIEAGDSMINLVLEMALQAIKKGDS